MPSLLLVDDDRYILTALQKMLASEGYLCHTARSGGDARRVLADVGCDLLVLDVNLPDTDGFTLCRRFREKHRMPILMLTARDASADKIIGLELGADDYVTKPFDPRELLARIRALLRRGAEYGRPCDSVAAITVGELVIDPERRDVFRAGAPAGLTKREFELIHFLAHHLGKPLAADWIFEHVWGYDAHPGSKTLAVYVHRLRGKIERDPNQPRYLLNVRGFGYQLVGDAACPAVSCHHQRGRHPAPALAPAGRLACLES